MEWARQGAAGPIGPGSRTGEDRPATGNRLLGQLAPGDRALLLPHLTRVSLAVGDVLAQSGEPIEQVCFLDSGIAGFLDVLADKRELAIGLLGREGFVGWPLLMGHARWPHKVVVRGRNCTALRLDAAQLADAVRQSEGLRALLLRYTAAFMAQMTRTIVSNLIHPVASRTARWLLLYHDRLDGDEIPLTHEELGAMLGVRRASVTDALHHLEGAGAIRGLRGVVVIRDRAHLEQLAGDTYGQAEAEYRALIGSVA